MQEPPVLLPRPRTSEQTEISRKAAKTAKTNGNAAGKTVLDTAVALRPPKNPKAPPLIINASEF
jgi:hypothetical protein